MKKLLIILLLGASFSSFAQSRSVKDLFTESSIVWYGIDYSKARFVGSFAQFKDAGMKDGNSIKKLYFPAWNDLIVDQHEKFNVAKFFKKEVQHNDLKSVEKVNSEVNGEDIMQDGEYFLEESALAGMVSKYHATSQKEGLGVVFITESYNQTRRLASYYVVVFDIASKEILLSEKFTAEPGGFGLKAYWGNTVLKVLEQVSKKYKKWQKSYGV